MTVKIDASALGIKRLVSVEETGKLMKDTLKLQKFLVKPVEEESDDPYLDFIENSLNAQISMEEYVKDSLHLTPAQSDKVEMLNSDDLGSLVSSITTKVLHLDIPEEVEDGEESGKE